MEIKNEQRTAYSSDYDCNDFMYMDWFSHRIHNTEYDKLTNKWNNANKTGPSPSIAMAKALQVKENSHVYA